MPVTELSDIDILSIQLQDLCLQSDKIDKEKAKVEKKILNFQQTRRMIVMTVFTRHF